LTNVLITGCTGFIGWWVDDHVNAYLLSMQNEAARGEVFNVSPGNPISNIDLAKKLADKLHFKGQIVEGSYPPSYPMRPAKLDKKYIVLDASKMLPRPWVDA